MFDSVLCTGSAFLPLSIKTSNGRNCASIPSLQRVIVFGSDDVFEQPLKSNIVYHTLTKLCFVVTLFDFAEIWRDIFSLVCIKASY